jgi:hypothetical protein
VAHRFAEKWLDGPIDEPQPGQPHRITDEVVEQSIVTPLKTTHDDGSTQWSTPSMAAKVGSTQTAVARIWLTFGLTPHRIEDFTLSTENGCAPGEGLAWSGLAGRGARTIVR